MKDVLSHRLGVSYIRPAGRRQRPQRWEEREGTKKKKIMQEKKKMRLENNKKAVIINGVFSSSAIRRFVLVGVFHA